MTNEGYSAPLVPPLTGSEHFTGVDATVSDFWRFAMSDLRMNNTRGYLAEFLVAKAVATTAPRVEWDAYDVLTPDGIKIEVKSSAYLQVWDQARLSRIEFTGLARRRWSSEGGRSPRATHNADVYVFCVQTAQSHDRYNLLDLAQWEFYVLPGEEVVGLGQQSVGLASIRGLTGGPVEYAGLASAVRTAAATRTQQA